MINLALRTSLFQKLRVCFTGVLFGNSTVGNVSLSKSLRFSTKLPQTLRRQNAQILAREIP